ncbi:branched-chain amino acid ABC transporter permease [Thermodesulfobacteriota bacterium]
MESEIQLVKVGGLNTRTWKRVGLAGVIVVAVLLPLIFSGYRIFQFTMMLIYAIALLGLNILIGYNGQFSLGHGAFYAVGAYTSAIMMEHLGTPYYLTIPVAGAICMVVGFLFGLPALRLQGLYLAVATLSLAIATPQFLKYPKLEHWTGGVQGIVIVKPDPPFGLPLDQDQWLYYFTLGIAVILFIAAWNILRSRTGRAMIAIREHHTAAETMGIHTSLIKTLTFSVSACYTGIAGALSAIVVQFVAPDSFNVFVSILFLLGSVVGGLASISGAVFGAIFLQFVPNVAELISEAAPWAVYGVFVIGFIYLMPTGIAGSMRLIAGWLERKASASPPQ